MIDEIILELHKKVHAHYMDNPQPPVVSIFIQDDYKQKLLTETRGLVSTVVEADYHNGRGETIMGYDVNTIISNSTKPYFIFVE